MIEILNISSKIYIKADLKAERLIYFGIIKSKLYKQKTMITDADIMIAATCIVTCEKLITGNIRHYNRIDGLIIEDWIH